MSLNDYFDAVFVLNLKRRFDRAIQCAHELAGSGISPHIIHWVAAYDNPDDGHQGCTRTHRQLYRDIATGPYERVLILEDDFKVLTAEDLEDNGFYPTAQVFKTFRSLPGITFIERFNALIPFLPSEWDILYLSGGYGEPPLSRLNEHVVRCGFMQGTGCYGITKWMAQRLSVWIDTLAGPSLDNHPGPIDNTLGLFAKNALYYCIQPRLAFQRKSMSDITGQETSYLLSMTDPVHENMV